jgi:hypothetical protein
MVNLKRFTKMKKGGHFAALEVPELWVNELRSFFFEEAEHAVSERLMHSEVK